MTNRHTNDRINILAFFVTFIGAIAFLALAEFAQPSPGAIALLALVSCCVVPASIWLIIQTRESILARQHGAGDPPER